MDNIFELVNTNSEQQNNGVKYVSKKEKMKMLIESDDFKKHFNLTHGKGKRKKKKRRK